MKPLLLIAAVVLSGCSPLSNDDLKAVAKNCKGVVIYIFTINPFWQKVRSFFTTPTEPEEV